MTNKNICDIKEGGIIGYGKISKQEAQRRKELFEQGIKVCSKCKKELPLNHFTKEKCKKDGYCSLCKDCAKLQRKERKEYIQQYQENHKEERQQYLINYYLLNKEKRQNYNNNNKERFRIARKINDHKPHNRYKLYQRNAEIRGIEFNISLEEFDRITQLPCYYCGEIQKDEFDYCFSGIDRVDSNQGYVLSNIVPCCNMCNKMKLNYTTDEWLKKIIQIVQNLNLINKN